MRYFIIFVLFQYPQMNCLRYSMMMNLEKYSYLINAQEPVDNKKTGVKSEKAKSIDAIYSASALGWAVKHREILGEFAYMEPNKSIGKYLAKFVTEESVPTIGYVSYADDKKDAIIFGKQTFSLENKIDPFSLTVYWVYNYGRKYLCLIGKGQSASGSGVQVSYFMLFQLEKSGKATSCQEFVSRFGNINSLVDYYKNGDIAYLRIVNGKKMDQYLLTLNDIKTNKQLDKKNTCA